MGRIVVKLRESYKPLLLPRALPKADSRKTTHFIPSGGTVADFRSGPSASAPEPGFGTRAHLAPYRPFVQLRRITDGGYRGSGTAGGKWGCALAVVVGGPLLGLAVLVSALCDCIPDARCNHDLQWWLILGALAITLAIGVAGRALINRFFDRRGNGR